MAYRVRIRDPEQCLRLQEVSDLLGIKPRTLKQWVKDGKFPKPIKPTKGLSLWIWRDVSHWLEDQKAKRSTT